MRLHDRSWSTRSEDMPIPVRVIESVPNPSTGETPPYIVEYTDGSFDSFGLGAPLFKILTPNRSYLARLLELDPYSLAIEFVRGEFSIEGDLVAAVRFYCDRPGSRIRGGVFGAIAMFGMGRLESWFQTKARAARNIRFHYDQSNHFYEQFLDSRMVYSCAYFKEPDQTLDEAQFQKMEHICRKLDLTPGETLLDVGCGWGGLLMHAAEEHGTISTGCTLSRQQFHYASNLLATRGLGQNVCVELSDYRTMDGTFDKIASVGMVEHVGRRRMKKYFATLNKLLRPGGLLLNHGITRPESASDNGATLFVRRKVFPGGEIPYLSDVVRSAERSGFEVLDVESLRPHYALTCRAWVDRLQRNATQCLHHVDRSVYRTWLLAFAASAVFFEDGRLNLNQLLLYKPGSPASRPFTREYIYE